MPETNEHGNKQDNFRGDKGHGGREGSDSQEQAGDLGWGGQEGFSEVEPLELRLKGQGLGGGRARQREKPAQRPWGRTVPWAGGTGRWP